MRKGSVAIVPLFLGISLLLWFIWFFGSANDNLHKVNQLENLQHTQDRLLIAAAKKRSELEKENPQMSEDNVNKAVDIYIHNMMKLNKIDD